MGTRRGLGTTVMSWSRLAGMLTEDRSRGGMGARSGGSRGGRSGGGASGWYVGAPTL